ncbi:hypothetical protein AMD27_01375 [Acinetobacter sp. TGL-Y2]|uniref:hypothetical protein n=1 Tax=Acinetobacter sp. TGL-Y2 TaxID=1407071 RepID=UPI0007A64456|nr:hypothetical protein [Acinetobacter sp. TGL-Y2]AMW77679.1 hypothetical protein AMD27_01375 [Acinetobacter sp. TGL-Y2]
MSKAERYKEEADNAMGGYFQIGNHGIKTADYVEKYIDQKLKEDLGGYKGVSIPAYLMRCLEISYSEEYRAYVRHTLDKSSYE